MKYYIFEQTIILFENMDDKYLKKKEKIKEAASYLFETLGYMNATMEMIAGKVGMKKNSLYHYFQNKDDILSEIIKDDIENYFRELNTLLKDDIEIFGFVHKMISCQLAFIKEKTIKYSIDLELFIHFSKDKLRNYELYTEKEAELIYLFFEKNYFVKDIDKVKEFIRVLQMIIESTIFHYVCINCSKFVSNINFEDLKQELFNITDVLIKGVDLKEKY